MFGAIATSLALAITAATGMVRIPSGSFRPLYAGGSSARVAVAAFSLDRDVVTREDYLAFVTTHPTWRRSAVSRENADAGYLADWTGDLAPGAPASAPATSVSWHAAKAYCESRGRRLPTVAEWEYAGAASAAKRDAASDPAFRAHVLAAYSARHSRVVTDAGETNAFGVRGMHDRVWEWTEDFHPAMDMRGAHAAHEHHAYCASASIGATDPSDYPAFMRNAVRASVTKRSTLNALGFRCAA